MSALITVHELGEIAAAEIHGLDAIAVAHETLGALRLHLVLLGRARAQHSRARRPHPCDLDDRAVAIDERAERREVSAARCFDPLVHAADLGNSLHSRPSSSRPASFFEARTIHHDPGAGW